MLSKEEIERYQRQILLPELGKNGQERLKSAKVLVVGAGGLGAPALLYLAAAGIGKIGIVDNDVVNLSNLHRQVLFSTDAIGKPKINAAKEKLIELNPHCEVELFETVFSVENALEIAKNYDLIIDGTDNFPTRYLVNDVTVKLGMPNVHASISQFSGQVSVFNMPMGNGNFGPNYRDIYPEPPAPGEVPSCAEGGVIGVLPGIIGATQALEAIKIITKIGTILAGKIWLYNALTFETRILNFTKDPNNSVNSKNKENIQLIDYADFCGLKKEKYMKTISVKELKEMMENKINFQLIDVREPDEFEQKNMNGLLIPMNEIPKRFDEISKDKKVIVHCKMGGRSANVIHYLEQNHGFKNLYNLEGGIVAWLNLKN